MIARLLASFAALWTQPGDAEVSTYTAAVEQARMAELAMRPVIEADQGA